MSCSTTRTTGREDFWDVDFAGSGRLSPQSPLDSEDPGVAIAARVGYGRVAVSDSKTARDVGGLGGRDRAGGRENTRDFRSRFAVGDNLADDMVWTRNCESRMEQSLGESRKSRRPKLGFGYGGR